VRSASPRADALAAACEAPSGAEGRCRWIVLSLRIAARSSRASKARPSDRVVSLVGEARPGGGGLRVSRRRGGRVWRWGAGVVGEARPSGLLLLGSRGRGEVLWSCGPEIACQGPQLHKPFRWVGFPQVGRFRRLSTGACFRLGGVSVRP